MSLQTLERNSPSPQESLSENEDQGSLSSYEGFVCREGCAICLTPRPGASVGKHGGSLRIMNHLKKLNKLMRPQDAIRLAVELEKCSVRPSTRYMVVISTQGVQDTEETIVLGTEQMADIVKICLVLPLWRNTEIKLDGDGGFSVHCQDRHHILKPRSVQSMWTALQFLFKATDQARLHNYYDGGLSHTWMTFYRAQLTEDGVVLNEWNLQSDLESFRPDSPIYYDVSGVLDWSQLDTEKTTFKNALIQKLREVMLHSDLQEVTSRQLRQALEEQMKLDLKEYRAYLDQQMLVIFGQLEKPSQIHEYLYLGSEWNAANLVELKELEIGYILNITREIDNFYPETFKYKTIRLFDVPESELLKHWDDTYKFIKEVKENKSKILVHCKMGISRSAATVIAYTMKEYRMSLEDAKAHVKAHRSCINPNHGFMSQLKAYEGILKARYNDLFGTQAPSRITYQSRSCSDPNIRQRLFQDEQDEKEPMDSAYRAPLPPMAANSDEGRPGSVDPQSSNVLNQGIKHLLETRANDSLPPEKAEGMLNYLVSLKVPRLPEDEQDLGINVPSSSDSDSPFSSPLLTPPDEESIRFEARMFQDAEERGRKNDGGGESEEIHLEKPEETQNLVTSDSESHNRQPFAQNPATAHLPDDHAPSSYHDHTPSSSHLTNSLGLSHERVTRATSLPTTLGPASEQPCHPVSHFSPTKKSPSTRSVSSSRTHDSSEELERLAEVRSPPEDSNFGEESTKGSGGTPVRTTLIKGVTHRIKEIELMNTGAPPPKRRPDSAEKKGEALNHAFSDDSLPLLEANKDAVSPFLLPSDGKNLTSSPDPVTIASPSSISNISDAASNSYGAVGGGWDSSRSGCDSPNTLYKKACEVLEQKRGTQQTKGEENSLEVPKIDLSASVDDLSDSTSRGVKELLGVFDGGAGAGSKVSLKRSSSLRSSRVESGLSLHKRGSSSGDII